VTGLDVLARDPADVLTGVARDLDDVDLPDTSGVSSADRVGQLGPPLVRRPLGPAESTGSRPQRSLSIIDHAEIMTDAARPSKEATSGGLTAPHDEATLSGMAERLNDTERLAYLTTELAGMTRRNRMWGALHSAYTWTLIALNGNCDICDNEGTRACRTCDGESVLENGTNCPDCRTGYVACGCGHIPWDPA
jgi:hypothetical protein